MTHNYTNFRCLVLFILCTVIVVLYIYISQQMHIKCVKLRVICIHNLSYMFCQIFTIFREMIIQRNY